MVTYDPSYKTANISQYGNPTQVASLYPTNTKAGVAQNASIWGDSIYESSSESGSASGFYTTLITRFMSAQSSTTNNPEADHMRIYDGGHGFGVTIERSKISGTGNWVWASLQGQNQVSAPRGGMLARFAYTPGDYHISEIPGGFTFMPWFPNYQGVQQESIYGFDWDKNWCVERQWDFATNNRERYTRRKITDVIAGIDQPYGQLWAPVAPPTTQGFTTINDTFFRWIGHANDTMLGQFNTADPMALEQWDWNTGQKVGYKEFPTLAQTNSTPGQLWKDGRYEPEGATVYRESDGTASLIVGVTVGAPGSHRWPFFKFSNIGQA